MCFIYQKALRKSGGGAAYAKIHGGAAKQK
jgi:hypothetical protein